MLVLLLWFASFSSSSSSSAIPGGCLRPPALGPGLLDWGRGIPSTSLSESFAPQPASERQQKADVSEGSCTVTCVISYQLPPSGSFHALKHDSPFNHGQSKHALAPPKRYRATAALGHEPQPDHHVGAGLRATAGMCGAAKLIGAICFECSDLLCSRSRRILAEWIHVAVAARQVSASQAPGLTGLLLPEDPRLPSGAHRRQPPCSEAPANLAGRLSLPENPYKPRSAY